jgi:Tfp pilus assembly protein PilN
MCNKRLQELIEIVDMLPEKDDHIFRLVSGKDLRIFVWKIREQQQEIERLTKERERYFKDRIIWIEISKIQSKLQQVNERIEQYEKSLNEAYEATIITKQALEDEIK